MDANLAGILALTVGIAALAILWIRVRAFEALAVEESTLRIETTHRAIESLEVGLAPLGDELGARGARRKRRRGRKRDRRRP